MTCGSGWKRFSLIGAFAGVLLLHFSPATADEPAASTSVTPADVPGWMLRLPPEAPVAYHGVANFDEAGMGTGGMVYPAFGVAGLLAAVVTHGVIIDAAKQKQKDQLQAKADEVLIPYKPFLEKFAYRDLMQRAAAKVKFGGEGRLIEPGVDAGHATLVESAPVLKLTQDQKAIVLDNMLAIQLPGVSSESAYRTSIRVVSSPSNLTEPAAFWSENDGERIKDESARLVAESIDIAFGEAAKVAVGNNAPYRTVRYMEGMNEKIERAQVLADQCERVLIRTLRGNLMSVPVARSALVEASELRCKSEASSL